MAPSTSPRRTVLIVDDDTSVLAGYRRLLDRAGYETHAESDPQRVLERLDDVRGSDLLVLDFKMPGMDGLTLLAELRRRDVRARCILVSAYLNDGVRQTAGLLGVDRVLEKPVHVESFRRAVAELLPEGDDARASIAV